MGLICKLLVHPRLRRWSQVQIGDAVLAEGAVPVQETTAGDPMWLDLEDRVQHHYAPLSFLNWDDDGKLTVKSCRCEFNPLRVCPP